MKPAFAVAWGVITGLIIVFILRDTIGANVTVILGIMTLSVVFSVGINLIFWRPQKDEDD
ncbi:MAG: hypothetical protein ACPGOV_09495 [Magnetovibrionaceae bacterium]